MTTNDTPSAAEVLELVEMLHRASELAPLAKVGHLNCESAFRAIGRFFGALEEHIQTAPGSANGVPGMEAAVEDPSA
jgi:hypothetical protein